MHRLIGTSISCGVRELVELAHPPKSLVAHVATNKLRDDNFSVVLFSDSERRGNGNRLAEFIKQNKLGVVKSTAKHVNPNSEQMIRVFVWQLPPNKVLKKYKPSRPNPDWDIADSMYYTQIYYGS